MRQIGSIMEPGSHKKEFLPKVEPESCPARLACKEEYQELRALHCLGTKDAKDASL